MSRPARRRAVIVIVEDDPDIRAILANFLERDFATHQADDGDTGLQLIRRIRPQLAIIDIRMPRMHGFELVQRLREDRGLDGIKIVMISAKSYECDIKTAKEIGVDDYVIKPFDPKVLRGKIQALLGLAKT